MSELSSGKYSFFMTNPILIANISHNANHDHMAFIIVAKASDFSTAFNEYVKKLTLRILL